MKKKLIQSLPHMKNVKLLSFLPVSLIWGAISWWNFFWGERPLSWIFSSMAGDFSFGSRVFPNFLETGDLPYPRQWEKGVVCFFVWHLHGDFISNLPQQGFIFMIFWSLNAYILFKITKFLESWNLEMVLTAFVCYKFDDIVALKVTGAKLMKLGLMYGDILAFRKTIPEMASSSSFHSMCY